MTKTEIIFLLADNHKKFIGQFEPMDERQFFISINNKWNSGQQLDHIIRSVQPVVLAFALPLVLLRLFFGKANRPSRSYEALVEKYHAKLAKGGMASGRFVPKGLSFPEKQTAIKKLQALVRRLNKKIETRTEEELDIYLLPHPLLGKLTLREMLYFTAYHAEHHRENMIKNLEGSSFAK